MSAVGILGGSFDPVHRGHLALACHARRTLGLSRVLLLPCADPPHKPERTLAKRYHRLEMLYLAIEGWEALGVSTFEIAQGGLHYTIDTLRALRAEMAPITPVFLLGSDALADIGSWREHESLLEEFDFGVAVRPEGDVGPQPQPWPVYVHQRIAPMPESTDPAVGAGGRVFRLAIPTLAISSSLVRHARADRAALDELVPARVAGYIRCHGLYPEEARR